MKEEEISMNVRLYCQRALLGEITKNIRLITIDWDALKNFKFRVYFEVTPTLEEIEEMEAVTSEVLSGLPFEQVEPVEAIVLNQPMQTLPVYKCVIFARKE